MDLEIIDIIPKWNKSDRERQISYDIIYCGILTKWYKRTHLQNRNRFADTENKLVFAKGESGGGIISYNGEESEKEYMCLYS